MFGTQQVTSAKKVTKLSLLKNDCNLFAWLYITCQSRDGNMSEIFKHENQAFPPALSSLGKIRSIQKSDLIPCLKIEKKVDKPMVDMKAIDGAAMVNILRPEKCKTFEDYAKNMLPETS